MSPVSLQRHVTLAARHFSQLAYLPETARVPPLRIWHMLEDPRQGHARLRMSGRLADICAELDRLVTIESQTRCH